MSKENGGETHKERVDRELGELLQELRVALPGVQILMAFLLTIPFTPGFSKLDDTDRALYFTSLLCTAIATVFLMSPTAFHRLHFRAGEKERLLFTSNRLAIAGLVLLAIAIVLALSVIAHVLFGATAAWVVAILIGGTYGWFWFGMPLLRRTE